MPDTSALADRVQRLEDLEEIRGLFLDYGRCLDAADSEGYARLFADDGEVILDAAGRATGQPAIEELIQRLVAPGSDRSVHHIISNPLIDLDGDRATARVTWTMITRTPEGRPVVAMQGHHNDVLAKQVGRWRFLRREGVVEIPSGMPTGPTAKPAGRESSHS